MYSTTLHTEEGNLSRKQAFDCDHGDTQEEITRRKHNSSKAIYLQFSSHYSLKTNIKELEINSPESKTYHSLTMQHVTTASNVIFPYIFTFGTPFRTQSIYLPYLTFSSNIIKCIPSKQQSVPPTGKLQRCQCTYATNGATGSYILTYFSILVATLETQAAIRHDSTRTSSESGSVSLLAVCPADILPLVADTAGVETVTLALVVAGTVAASVPASLSPPPLSATTSDTSPTLSAATDPVSAVIEVSEDDCTTGIEGFMCSAVPLLPGSLTSGMVIAASTACSSRTSAVDCSGDDMDDAAALCGETVAEEAATTEIAAVASGAVAELSPMPPVDETVSRVSVTAVDWSVTSVDTGNDVLTMAAVYTNDEETDTALASELALTGPSSTVLVMTAVTFSDTVSPSTVSAAASTTNNHFCVITRIRQIFKKATHFMF